MKFENFIDEQKDSKPEPLSKNKIDLKVLNIRVMEHVDNVWKGNHRPGGDAEHLIYEAAMEAIYGKSIWKDLKDKWR